MTEPTTPEINIKLETPPYMQHDYFHQLPDHQQLSPLPHEQPQQVQVQPIPSAALDPLLLGPAAQPLSPPAQEPHRVPLSYCQLHDRVRCTVTTDGKRCNRQFDNEGRLRAHHRRLHDKLMDPCPFCGQRFQGRFSWGLHMEKEHGVFVADCKVEEGDEVKIIQLGGVGGVLQ
ncbi:hypothetical protein BO86DRAFT_156602 [Aspergillus japonicus CBS 114.51]|uniref:C2H2-type domain-containing protein n=2 Tax=Aspergillus TaxID=5052 RepID=A0A2V5HG35_ASPV1|nr:hypothetical protein BO86DRAFT_156602 [Aspergillus japonicus CBS 114.51]PYI14950.1 hypothetical protein BO99DRAFT_416407 [Aspergillus violaceofuscus CBS 115571]RAH79166.1 hypothetical protein BO86DRAFT_156602 [Aspergillus japonicus CBS 114.51]